MIYRPTLWITCLIVLALAGCATGTHQHGGGYYPGDGPPEDTDVDLASIPDAVPKNVPLSKNGNPSSYSALGKTYYVLKSAAGFTQTGLASWYGRGFNGKRTSSGDPYNMFAMTAAHKRLPIPSWVRVTNLDNHKQAVVKINDRGPFHDGRIIDLSYVAARRLGIVATGTAPVRIETVTPETVNQPDSPSEKQGTSVVQNPTGNAATQHQNRAQPNPAASSPEKGHSKRSGPMLQVGAFSSATHADRARSEALHSGVEQVAVVPPSSDRRLYRVRVGPFDSPAALSAAKKQLVEAGLPARRVTR